ncbi:MAG: CrcB family protein [Actinomycetota bacterium]|nr:CrcB family protein [Actinomycetota bacterium]
MQIVLVAVLGAAGALARYGLGSWLGGSSFPWTTLGINVAGCFVLGWLLVWGPDHLDERVATGVGIGFLGAFTTFSTFGVESHRLLRDDRPAAALTYVALSVVLGVAAAAVGYWVARRAA